MSNDIAKLIDDIKSRMETLKGSMEAETKNRETGYNKFTTYDYTTHFPDKNFIKYGFQIKFYDKNNEFDCVELEHYPYPESCKKYYENTMGKSFHGRLFEVSGDDEGTNDLDSAMSTLTTYALDKMKS